MSITCKDLLNLKYFQEIKLAAGAKGLDRVITYPYIGQTASVADWVHGGELLFITGLSHDIDSLPLLLQECISKKLAGLVVLTHPEHIEAIPAEILKMADEANFPLFSMPWDLRLVDVTKEITELIDYEQIVSKKMHRLLSYLIFTGNTDNSLIFDLEALANINISNYNLVAVFAYSKTLTLLDDTLETNLQYYLKKLCEAKHIPNLSMVYGNKVILLINAYTQKEMETYITYMEKLYESLTVLCNDDNLLLAIGDIHKGSNQIRTSYQEAEATMGILQKIPFKQLCRYKDLGLYRLFLQMQPSEMEYFYHSQLDVLIEYDKCNNADMLRTLKFYLEAYNNISKTAKNLVIHRNTLVYRITKIEEVLGRDLNNPLVCIELLLALFIKTYLENIE